nr:hypothetical protein CFP56_12698 [Quercus suber]
MEKGNFGLNPRVLMEPKGRGNDTMTGNWTSFQDREPSAHLLEEEMEGDDEEMEGEEEEAEEEEVDKDEGDGE